MKNIEKFIPIIVIVFCMLTLFRTCGVGNDIKKTNKRLGDIENKIDSLQRITITEDELTKRLETTVMWETLVLEELSDKQRMPINHYRNQK
jgi:hypothetical protein